MMEKKQIPLCELQMGSIYADNKESGHHKNNNNNKQPRNVICEWNTLSFQNLSGKHDHG